MLPTEIPNPSFLHSALLILQITVTLGQKVVVFYKNDVAELRCKNHQELIQRYMIYLPLSTQSNIFLPWE